MTANPARFASLRPFSRLAGRCAVAGAVALAGLVASAGLVGCSTTRPEVAIERGELDPGSFEVAWRVEVPERLGDVKRMALRDDFLFAYSDNNSVQAISVEGGTTRFITDRIVGPRETLRAPVIIETLGRLGSNQDRVLVFPSSKTMVVTTLDGQVIRNSPLKYGTTSGSIQSAGLIYTATSSNYGGRIAKIDPLKPAAQVVDEVQVDGAINSTPAVFQRTIFAADSQGEIYGITEGMNQAWDQKSFRVERDITAGLAADEYGVYVAGQDGVLYVLDRQRGKLKWRYFNDAPLYRTPVPTSRMVFLATGTSVVALDKLDGAMTSREPKWVVDGAVGFLSHDDSRVYLLLGDGHIGAFDKQSGEELFRSKRNDFVKFAQNRGGSRIFAYTPDGSLIAIDPVTQRKYGEMAMLD